MDRRSRELTASELRSVHLELLERFSNYCESQQLTYVMTAGTLLGAVRHGGFIPWDDDADLAMPRSDYQRLLAMADDFQSATGCSLRYSRGVRDSYPFPFLKVCDSRTLLLEHTTNTVPLGVNIDVFPIDTWPRSMSASHALRVVLTTLVRALNVRSILPNPGRGRLRSTLLKIVKWPAFLLPVGVTVTLLSRIAARPRANPERAGVITWGYLEDPPVDAWKPGDLMRFEDLYLRAPLDPNAILRNLYGDYRELPPPEQRVSHHAFTATWSDSSA